MSDFGIARNLGRYVRGGVSGLTGGVAFGIMVTFLGMMGGIGMLVGSTNLGVAWAVHAFNSILFGVIFGAVVATRSYGKDLLYGAIWGLILWATAYLIVMRTVLGQGIAIDQPAIMSLMGHLLYGVVLGLMYAWLRHLPIATQREARPVA